MSLTLREVMASKKKKGKAKKGKRAKADRKLPKALRKGLPRSVADVLAAGLGALDRAQSTGTDEFQTLVERGRAVEKRGSDAVRGATDRVGQVVDDTVGAARARRQAAQLAFQSRVEAAVEVAVGTLGLPSGDEVAALRQQIGRLEQRLAGHDAVGQRFRVASHPDGWALEREGADRALSVHATKKAALVAARAHAKAHAPSELVILRADGTEADAVQYEG